ncbi:MAG: hypothetical protein K6V36_06775 [Anaerolineae bacterium]|nr:hypothetical protein [Anaerolineae bacterium]
MIPVTPALREYFRMETLGAYLGNSELLEVDGVLVDVANVLQRRYRCDTSCCVYRLDREVHGRSLAGDCCHRPEVRLAAGEEEGLLAHLEGIMRHMAPGSREMLIGRLARCQEDPGLAFSSPVIVNGRLTGHRRLRLTPAGDCLFRFEGYENGRPFVRCAIHAYLLESGLPLWGIKPMTCWVWPLAVVPLYDGRLLLTLHTRDTLMFTGEGHYHASRPCLLHPPEDAPFVYQTAEQELRQLLGNDFYDHLLKAIGEPAPHGLPA